MQKKKCKCITQGETQARKKILKKKGNTGKYVIKIGQYKGGKCWQIKTEKQGKMQEIKLYMHKNRGNGGKLIFKI